MALILGSEFLVNFTTSSNQLQSSITGLADGRFVVTWCDESQTGGDVSGRAIRAQIFTAEGAPTGSEFLVNSATTGAQGFPSVAPLKDGGFVISWTDSSTGAGDTSGTAIRAQVFNSNATKLGSEFLVNTTTDNAQYASCVTALSDGGFVVTWSDNSMSGGDTVGAAVRAQLFASDGVKVGGEFQVNAIINNNQLGSFVGALDNGRFVIAWADNSQISGDTSDYGIRAQVYNADGSASGNEILVNTTTSNTQNDLTVTGLVDGRFVIAWTDHSETGGDTSGRSVRAQVFEADATPVNAEVLINSTVTNWQYDPQVTALEDGGWIFSWTNLSATGNDTSGASINAQVYAADGSSVGSEFLINSTTDDWQFDSSITRLVDGRLVVSWTDASATNGDLTGYAIRAKTIDPRVQAVDLVGSSLDDYLVGTGFDDIMAGAKGKDTLHGQNGADTLFGNKGNDFLVGGLGADTLRGGNGDDTLFGEGGKDILFGGAGDDRLVGGAGKDVLKGGLGVDKATGGAGNDIYIVENVLDTVIENPGGGKDLVRSGTISLKIADYARVENLSLTGGGDLDLTGRNTENKLTGNSGANTIKGRGGADRLNGGAGDDFLLGGTGSDKLTGGAGRDEMTGGTHADHFIFNAALDTGTTAATRDIIHDFNQTEADIIDLSAIDAQSGGGNQAFVFIGTDGFASTKGELRYSQNGGKTIIRGDKDGNGVADFEIELTGLHTLLVSDFVL